MWTHFHQVSLKGGSAFCGTVSPSLEFAFCSWWRIIWREVNVKIFLNYLSFIVFRPWLRQYKTIEPPLLGYLETWMWFIRPLFRLFVPHSPDRAATAHDNLMSLHVVFVHCGRRPVQWSMLGWRCAASATNYLSLATYQLLSVSWRVERPSAAVLRFL